MKKCPKCNRNIADDAKFCNSCGAPIPQVSVKTDIQQAPMNTDVQQILMNAEIQQALRNTEIQQEPMNTDVQQILMNAEIQQALRNTDILQAPTHTDVQQDLMNSEVQQALRNTDIQQESINTEMQQPPMYSDMQQSPMNPQSTVGYSNMSLQNQAVHTQPAGNPPRVKKPIPKGVFIGGGIAAFAILAIFIVVQIITGGVKDNFVLYVQEGEIFYTDFSTKKGNQITEELAMNGYSASLLADTENGIARYIATAQDSNRIFYPDNVYSTSYGVELYYRDRSKSKDKPILIDSDIEQYAINNDGTQIVYLEGYDGNLYLSDLKEKEKIAGEVDSFFVSDDFKTIMYMTEDGNFYVWRQGNDKEKLASDIYSLEYVAEDMSVIYYIKDDSLYKQTTDGADKVKIASDVYEVGNVYPTGEVYYTKREESTMYYMDYIVDDYAEADAQITEPQYPTYPDSPQQPYWWSYGSDEEYNAAYAVYEQEYAQYLETRERMKAEYDAASEQYWAKVQRDYIREVLNDHGYSYENIQLYFYDGTQETMITEDVDYYTDMYSAQDRPAISYQIITTPPIEKIVLSEIYDAYDTLDILLDAFRSDTMNYLAVGAEQITLGEETIVNMAFAPDASAYYYMRSDSDTGAIDLYKIAITEGKASSAIRLDQDVNDIHLECYSDGSYVYFKDYDYDKVSGDLYFNGTLLHSDASLMSLKYRDNVFYYYIDYSFNRSCGTLMRYENGESTKIADDVYTYEFTADNDVIYLYDYSRSAFTGTLYRYSNGKSKKLADEVGWILPDVFNEEADGVTIYGY
jgi:hypothetical protein